MGGAGSSGLKSGEMQSSPLLSHDQQQLPNGEGVSTSHISSMAAKEIQEALKDMEITRQVSSGKSKCETQGGTNNVVFAFTAYGFCFFRIIFLFINKRYSIYKNAQYQLLLFIYA